MAQIETLEDEFLNRISLVIRLEKYDGRVLQTNDKVRMVESALKRYYEKRLELTGKRRYKNHKINHAKIIRLLKTNRILREENMFLRKQLEVKNKKWWQFW